jgi:hypothetical protein
VQKRTSPAADEAGVSEQVYLTQVCEALGGTDCGEPVVEASENGGNQPAGNQPDDDNDDADADEADEPEDEPEDEEEPSVDPEEEPEDGEDNDIVVIDPELLWCFLDADSDGLFNCEEATYGTDPNIWDTDGDGLGDGIEVGSGLGDPLLVDTDNDALTDYQEMMYGTNPWSSDSDGDGSSDSGEIFWGTDPLDPDDYPLEWI